MTGQLILTAYTYDQGLNAINAAFSGSADFNILSAITISGGTISGGTIYISGTNVQTLINTLWSSSTGTNSIIANNNTGNLASGNTSLAWGLGSIAGGNISVSMGTLNEAIGVNDFIIGGSGNISNGNLNTSILGGTDNFANNTSQFSAIGGQNNSGVSASFNSFILGGFSNYCIGSSGGIIGGEGNILNSDYSVIIAGSGNTASAHGVIILGMSGFSASSSYTTYMKNAYIDNTLDLEPVSTMPSPRAGRLFYSGGSLNRLILFTGATSSDYMIL